MTVRIPTVLKPMIEYCAVIHECSVDEVVIEAAENMLRHWLQWEVIKDAVEEKAKKHKFCLED